MIEIEKKYLFNNTSNVNLGILKRKHIKQGYLQTNPVVRVRLIDGNEGHLEIKGPGTLSRAEFSYEIPAQDAIELLKFCPKYIDKTRYLFPYQNFVWEIDVFHGKLSGLYIAEIELQSENDVFTLPSFLNNAIDVTDNIWFQNSHLIDFENIEDIKDYYGIP